MILIFPLLWYKVIFFFFKSFMKSIMLILISLHSSDLRPISESFFCGKWGSCTIYHFK
ncbi:hypothetical protein CHCC20375_1916 [Bacillus licheniformis]|nr:hypothetical protein CHCC20375_1916 [Bacillus licheniformis]